MRPALGTAFTLAALLFGGWAADLLAATWPREWDDERVKP